MNSPLPQRIPVAHRIPHRATSEALALLIRVAAGLDEWAERDRTHAEAAPQSNHLRQNQ